MPEKELDGRRSGNKQVARARHSTGTTPVWSVHKIEQESPITNAQTSDGERIRLGRRVLLLSFIIVMLDGYDLLCMSFVAPALGRELGIAPAALGPLFSAGFAGVLVGGLAVGPVSDRLGRRPVLLAAVALFGLFSLVPAFDPDYARLIAYRLLTGIGVGAALPCAAALTAEFSPAERRGRRVSLMYAGVATGGVLGGFLASILIPHYGWQAAFWLGGGLPLLLLPVLFILMPESPAFRARVAGAVPDGARGSIPGLFRGGRAPTTLLLWAASFCALFTFGLTVSWLPAILSANGVPMGRAILGPVVMNLGGLLGTVLIGLILTRLGLARTISIAFALGALAMAAAGFVLTVPTTGFAAIFIAGLFLLGGINAANALAASSYPAELRATGSGWALGAGRIGGVAGPAVGGLMVGAGAAPSMVFLLAAAVLAGGMGAMAALARRPVQA